MCMVRFFRQRIPMLLRKVAQAQMLHFIQSRRIALFFESVELEPDAEIGEKDGFRPGTDQFTGKSRRDAI